MTIAIPIPIMAIDLDDYEVVLVIMLISEEEEGGV